MEFIFAGGALEVGGSCIYIRTNNCGILLDAGIRQGSGKDPLPDFRSIQNAGGVDAILISHAHMDHIGSLPVISKAYPAAPVYMTRMTADLARVLLYDSLKIMDRREDEIPCYSEPDVRSMLDRIRTVRYLAPTEILDQIFVTLYPAGHIGGAACMNLSTPEGTIFYSGDVSNFSQRTIEGARIPKLRPDVAILESTYGNRMHSNRQTEEKRLVSLVGDYARKKAHILIPAFALGRAQEVLLILRSAIQNGELPALPIYVDGMVRDINRVYTQNPSFLKNALARRILKGLEPFYTDEIRAVKPTEDRNALFEKSGPAVFISSSGMLTGGPSLLYAKKILPMENACIIITGYQDEEAPGRTLLNLLDGQETKDSETERRITLDGTALPVRCHVEQVGLSAHGDQSELSGIIDRLSARKIILVHGDKDAVSTLGTHLSTDIRRQIFQPVAGDCLELNIHNKRKQISFRLANSMQKFQQEPNLLPEGERAKEFWAYWNEHYENKSLTLDQAAYVWSGKKQHDEDWLQSFQDSLLDSPYFSRDLKRLFLLHPNTEEEIQKLLQKSKATAQDVEAWIRSQCQSLEIRKLGFYPTEKRVVLSFDFPDIVDSEEFQNYKKELEQALGWSMELGPSMNHQAAAGILNSLFPNQIRKISYYEVKKEYQITLSDSKDPDTQAAWELHQKEFFKQTGWRLCINGSSPEAPVHACGSLHGSAGQAASDSWFLPKPGAEALEQNLALSCLEQSFDTPELKSGQAPYKTGIKHDSDGSYMELSFLSPALGKRHQALLQQAADQIGWRLHISESVNQNALGMIALELCDAYQIHPAKNPSYLPGNQSIRLKCPDISKLPEQMQQEFFERTGCELSLGS